MAGVFERGQISDSRAPVKCAFQSTEGALRNLHHRPHRPVYSRASLQPETPFVDRAIQPPTTALVVWKPSPRDQVAEFFRQVRAMWKRMEPGVRQLKAFLEQASRALDRFVR